MMKLRVYLGLGADSDSPQSWTAWRISECGDLQKRRTAEGQKLTKHNFQSGRILRALTWSTSAHLQVGDALAQLSATWSSN